MPLYKTCSSLLPIYLGFKYQTTQRKLEIQPITTQCRILTQSRYIAVENIVRKGEIACNKQISPFITMFSILYDTYVLYLIFLLIFHSKCTLKCCLQVVSIWTSLKFCCLVMG